MKRKFLKNILTVFVIFIVFFWTYKILISKTINDTNSQENNLSRDIELTSDIINLSITDLDTINPIISTNRNVYDISKLIFEPLIQIDNNFKAIPCLAQEWSNLDDTTYIIKLNKNAKWSDGKEFTAKDFVFTVDMLKNDKIKSIYKSNIENIDNIEILDDKSIKIYLKASDDFFEYNLTFPILASHHYDEDFLDETKNKTTIGTGPYKIYDFTENTVTLKKNTYWWQDKNIGFNTINIRLYTNISKTYNDFKSEKIDFINITNSNWEEMIGSIGYNYSEYAGRDLDFITLNCNNNILNNQEVRRAISFAIDKDIIINEVYSGKKIKANSIVNDKSWLYNDDLTSTYNVQKAKQLLIDNGWYVENDVFTKKINNKKVKLNITLLVNNNNEDRCNVAEIIKNNLSSINIDVTIKSVNNIEYNKLLKSKNFDMVIMGITSNFNPNIDFFVGKENYANYENSEIDSLLENIEDLQKSYNKIQEIIENDCPYIPLYFNKNILAYNQKITGNITPTWNNIFLNIETWTKKL